MRLAAVVLAPVGRLSDLPPDDQLPTLIEAIVPGLDKIAASHRPLIRRWPSQVSARGFAHLFFANAKLPGDGGKGSPWSSVAGMFKLKGQPVMAALILRPPARTASGRRSSKRSTSGWAVCGCGGRRAGASRSCNPMIYEQVGQTFLSARNSASEDGSGRQECLPHLFLPLGIGIYPSKQLY